MASWVVESSTLSRVLTSFFSPRYLISSRSANFDSLILDTFDIGVNEKFIKAIGYRLSDRAYFRDLLYESGYICIDLSIHIYTHFCSASNKRENNNVIEQWINKFVISNRNKYTNVIECNNITIFTTHFGKYIYIIKKFLHVIMVKSHLANYETSIVAN